ncbi:MAG: Rrf2 family transcriptional regulator [Flavobacteriales bacterium]|nr:Rrf2 family transcriptional regulator [Flavobacteriales bacterium]
MFSKACEYGIRSAIFIAEQSMEGKKVSIKDVTQALDSPEAYTSKILQKLKNNGIIDSEKGPRGGFSIDNERMESVMLKDIVFTFDGESVYSNCGLGLKQCNALKPCPVHHQFAIIRDEINKLLEGSSIKTLALDLQEGLSFLKR